MTICRMTRLSSATRIFTVAPRSSVRWCVVRGRERRQSALHGDGERLAAPQDVDAADVGGVAAARGASPTSGRLRADGPGRAALTLPPTTLAISPNASATSSSSSTVGRVVRRAAPGSAPRRSCAAGGEDDAAGPRADDVDPGWTATSAGSSPGSGTRNSSSPTRAIHASSAMRLDRRLVDQLGDDRAGVAAAATLAGVRVGRHSATSWGSRPSSASLSRMRVGGERLDHVLVGAGGQGPDDLAVLALGGDHHDRHLRARPGWRGRRRRTAARPSPACSSRRRPGRGPSRSSSTSRPSRPWPACCPRSRDPRGSRRRCGASRGSRRSPEHARQFPFSGR